MQIGYTIVDSPLGRLLGAANTRGVCAVAMGASNGELKGTLAREYPSADTVPDRGRLARWTNEIVAHLGGRRPRLALPLDVEATAFQWQAWKALGAGPYGDTRSCSDVAATIGRPDAARAVARACATNPLALATPCHRVVSASGGGGGYRWGIGRKRALLNRERVEGEIADNNSR